MRDFVEHKARRKLEENISTKRERLTQLACIFVEGWLEIKTIIITQGKFRDSLAHQQYTFSPLS